jgi:hypothetical protein
MGGMNNSIYPTNPVGWVDPLGLDGAALVGSFFVKGKAESIPQSKSDSQWIPACPERTEKYICEGLKNENLIDRNKEGMRNDLSWRDAEHYLFAYDTTLKTKGAALPVMFYSSLLWSGAKKIGQPFGILDKSSPGSRGEAQMGIDGSFDAMSLILGKEHRRWGNNCD